MDHDQKDLLRELDMHSKVYGDDLKEIEGLKYKNGSVKNIGRISIAMKKVRKGDKIKRRFYLESIPIANFALKDIKTKHREHLWNRYW